MLSTRKQRAREQEIAVNMQQSNAANNNLRPQVRLKLKDYFRRTSLLSSR